jgi:hypothetical protein
MYPLMHSRKSFGAYPSKMMDMLDGRSPAILEKAKMR